MNLQQLLKKIGKIPGVNKLFQQVLNTVVGAVKSLLSKVKPTPPTPIAHMAGDQHPSATPKPHAAQEAAPQTKPPTGTPQTVHPTADTGLAFASQKHAALDGDRVFRPDTLSPVANPLHWLVDPEAQKVLRMLEQMPGIVDSALRSSHSSQEAFNFLLAKPLSLSSEIIDAIIQQHQATQQANEVGLGTHGQPPLPTLAPVNQPLASPPAQTMPEILKGLRDKAIDFYNTYRPPILAPITSGWEISNWDPATLFAPSPSGTETYALDAPKKVFNPQHIPNSQNTSPIYHSDTDRYTSAVISNACGQISLSIMLNMMAGKPVKDDDPGHVLSVWFDPDFNEGSIERTKLSQLNHLANHFGYSLDRITGDNGKPGYHTLNK